MQIDLGDDDDDDEMDGVDESRARNVRLYFCAVLIFFGLFTMFSLILWGASKGYKPKIFVKVRYFLVFYFIFCTLH